MVKARYKITPEVDVVCSDEVIDIYQYASSGDDVDLVTLSPEIFRKLVTTVEKHLAAWQTVGGPAN